MIGAGQRDTRVIFERATVVEDEHGSLGEPVWKEFCRAWAFVLYGSGAERREAAQKASSQAATLTVLANSQTTALKTTDRARFAGGVWDISGNIRVEGRAMRGITAIRGQD